MFFLPSVNKVCISFLGLNELVPDNLLTMFSEQELEVSGAFFSVQFYHRLMSVKHGNLNIEVFDILPPFSFSFVAQAISV